MVFILYCLIMRTAYQGMMFKLLTSDVRKQEMQTIEEMVDKNLTIDIGYAQKFLKPMKADIDILKRWDFSLCMIKEFKNLLVYIQVTHNIFRVWRWLQL